MALEPCVPRPSQRTMRKRATYAAMALMVGLLAVVMGGESGRHFMMPGKLSSPHAGLTDCSTCHAGARSGRVDLLHRLFTAVEPRQNSNLCLTCHVMGSEPFRPHTRPVEDLARITEAFRNASNNASPETVVQRVLFPASPRSLTEEPEIHCATCHREHQGVFADLKAVSNQRCQACHTSRFGSFADSHPQFAKFPYQRRPRIIFDHQSHMAKHFPEAIKAAVAGQVVPGSCADCHEPGVRKRFMVVKSFATMCSGCHNDDIMGVTQVSGPKGVDVLAVPGLDVRTLRERGIDIGSWPENSEAKVTPFMRLLLDSNGDNVLSAVAKLDLLDLSKASDQDLAHVAALAWAVKRLFNRLETANPAAAAALARDRSTKQIEMTALTGGMSHDVITAGNGDWFEGNLQDDLQRHERGEPTRNFKPPEQPKTEAARQPPSAAGDGNAIVAAKPPSSSPSSDDILAPQASPGGNKDDILGSESKNDALTPNKNDDILGPSKGGQDDILSGQKAAPGNILSATGDDSSALKKDETGTDAGTKKSADTAPTPFDPELWAQTGGWYRADFTIRYRPGGHADRFLQSWLDLAGRGYGSRLHDQLQPIFDTLAPKDSVGRCTKCHSVDNQAGAKIVNWQPFDPNVIGNRFTNYSHKPHVELVGTKTCVKCHELRQTDDGFLKTYEAGDPLDYTPNFKHLDKAVCAACHSQQTAWENCTLCHGYHVPTVASNSPVPGVPVVFDNPIASVAGNAMPASDIDAGSEQDYAKAEGLGTKQAWEEFIGHHPSGPYHDLAIQHLHKQHLMQPENSPGAIPDTSAPSSSDKPAAVLLDNPAPAPPEKSATVGPDTLVQASPEKPARVEPDGSAQTAPGKPASAPDKLAIAAPDDSSSVAPAKPAEADSAEPSDPDALWHRGQQRALRGDLELAKQDFDEVIYRDPKHAGALNDRCWVLALLDEMQAALQDCDASLRATPNFPDALDSRGLVNLKLGNFKRAIADYTSALSELRGLKRASALYGRGIAKKRSGNAGGAKSDIEAAKAIKPTIVDEFASYGIQ